MDSKKLAKMVREQMTSEYDPAGAYTGQPKGKTPTRDVDDD